MEDLEADDLNLSLSIAIRTTDRRTDSGGGGIKRKRSPPLPLLSTSSSSTTTDGSPNHDGGNIEGKIFRLLQMREQIIKRPRTDTTHHRKSPPPAEDENDGGSKEGLHLIHSLLIAATAVDEGNSDSALENLAELYRTVSLVGDSVQRVVAHFADGAPTAEEEFLAFTDLYRVSPCYQFAHFTAKSVDHRGVRTARPLPPAAGNSGSPPRHRLRRLVRSPVASLIQALSERATPANRISLRVTGFGRGPDEIRETESRLVSFAKGFRNVAFEFQGLLRGAKLVNLRKRKNETVAVNLVFHLNTLGGDPVKISNTLRSVHALEPSVVVLVEHEGYRNTTSFLSRFMESLHYFAAMFDSLDDCLPMESPERLGIEKNLLGKEIKTMLNCDDYEDSNLRHHQGWRTTCGPPPRYEKMETWKGRMEGHGFAGVKLSSTTLIQAKLLLKVRAHYGPTVEVDGESGGGGAGFRVFERDDGKAISLGWQDRCLMTASTWNCV
ncbi:unnamed protein product [Linum tenue]|uniref:Uncharacterized protein n=1 Tax=Linum tenue TaxID=586396 RepID=A0AAV0II99_9ROSI|nr:unnamed protein product [Linum tenue]